MAFTVVSFHAHPDDEALLTGGTLARCVAEGHRVVIVTATDGAAGLADEHDHPREQLGSIRLRELEAAASALGVHRVVALGYADGAFSDTPVAEAADALAAVLREEGADVLTTYDRAGGYGHPDHVHVHRVGAAAARRACTPVVLEATVDRSLLMRATALMRMLPGRLPVSSASFAQSYSAPSEITHRVDVRPQVGAKRAALAAHLSQSTGAQTRTVRFLLAVPTVVGRRVLGHEWFIEQGRPVTEHPIDDIFASLR
ncbi:PIG-L domain-containing protein [Aeromicrobium sp. A1-2]|uniref:PIG-L deacetylase family protein n=1 Tax=Aeromicrobium sp. A1-2 TaxID=2107713 RepID=UPI000E474DBD|nr:PIG-L family deacetylase [Aeromicrobium sp. A1-2]AXT84654.1 PIG-L domain-containing protein [Aeromicrobium sp. A1-2]